MGTLLAGYGFRVPIESSGILGLRGRGVPWLGWNVEYVEYAENGMGREGWLGYDTCHCLALVYSFTAFMHIIYCCLLGGMCVHFNSQV